MVCRVIHDLEFSSGRGQHHKRLVGTTSIGDPLLYQRHRRCDTAPCGGLAGWAVALRHPRHELDDLLGHPVRFSVVALLAAAARAEFSFVRDRVEVTDSMLSKQISVLEQAGYIKVDKGFVGKRARTWLSLTKEGRRRFERHLAALREIAGGDGIGSAAAAYARARL